MRRFRRFKVLSAISAVWERQAFESYFSRPFALLTRVHRGHREKQYIFFSVTADKIG